ncbi:transmembrane channel-like protein 7 isoform X2 [Argopecten irradians]|uniref:transmembrane channel-like protein 7 isoform X2 n=1 Tax=Argopecten irradians TaxID=31199 RepID=UPI00371319AF
MDYRGNPNGYHGPRGQPEQLQMHSVNPGYTDPSPTDNGRPPYVIDMQAGIHDLDDRNGGEEFEDGRKLRTTGSRRNWAADNQRDATDLINELPSRQLEQIASDVARQTIRRKKSKKKSFHGTVRGVQDYNDLAASLSRDPVLMDEIDGETRTNEMLRDMAVRLSDKKEIRNNISNSRQQTIRRGGLRSRRPGWWKRTKYNIGIGWMHFKYRLAELAYSLELWRSLIKKIEGHFGTGVTSYFLFLKWIFLLNIPIFLLTLGFIVIPQIVYVEYQPSQEAIAEAAAQSNMTNFTTAATVVTATRAAFTGKEILTGSDYFTDTVLYYGYYTNDKVQVIGLTKYDMKYAYLLTGGGYYILCLIILALSISRSYKKNYIEASGVFNFYIVTKVFCGWDYNITSPDATRLRHKSFINEIKEFLSGKKFEDKSRRFSSKCKWFFVRVITNLIVLGSIGGSGYGIYRIQDENYVQSDLVILGKLAMPLVATGIILILPFFFTRIGKLENYQKPQTELYVSMTRTMLLKATILGVLAYFWFKQSEKKDICWETALGEDIYRLVLVDFIFILIATFFLEFIRRLFGQYCCKQLGDTEFDIGRNTLDLIYSQALCWLGTFYSPLLSFIMSVKLFIIFYVKAISVLQNCKPSVRAWRASKSHTIFLGYLFIFFLLAAIAVSYGVLLVKPSRICGPFQGQEQAYDIVTDLIDSWKGDLEWLRQIFKLVSSPGFIASVLVAFSVGTYYMRIVMVGHKEMVKLLRQQLAMEGRDKAYLLNMLQDVSRSRKEKLRPSTDNRILSSTASVESLTSPEVLPIIARWTKVCPKNGRDCGR